MLTVYDCCQNCRTTTTLFITYFCLFCSVFIHLMPWVGRLCFFFSSGWRKMCCIIVCTWICSEQRPNHCDYGAVIWYHAVWVTSVLNVRSGGVEDNVISVKVELLHLADSGPRIERFSIIYHTHTVMTSDMHRARVICRLLPSLIHHSTLAIMYNNSSLFCNHCSANTHYVAVADIFDAARTATKSFPIDIEVFNLLFMLKSSHDHHLLENTDSLEWNEVHQN